MKTALTIKLLQYFNYLKLKHVNFFSCFQFTAVLYIVIKCTLRSRLSRSEHVGAIAQLVRAACLVNRRSWVQIPCIDALTVVLFFLFLQLPVFLLCNYIQLGHGCPCCLNEQVSSVVYSYKFFSYNCVFSASDSSGNIFYTPEYRDTFLSLLRKFNMSKQSKYE